MKTVTPAKADRALTAYIRCAARERLADAILARAADGTAKARKAFHSGHKWARKAADNLAIVRTFIRERA